MKHLLLTTIAAVVLAGCAATQQPKPTTDKAPDISIHEAAYTGNIEAVKQHLAAGTDVNTADRMRRTPLLEAATGGRREVAELLLAKGADVNALSVYGTPLDRAVERDQTETVALLRKHGGKTGDELKAIEAVKQHIAAGTDVNAKDEKGATPFAWCGFYQSHGNRRTADR